MSFHDVIRVNKPTALAKPYRSLEMIDFSRLLLRAGGRLQAQTGISKLLVK